MNNNEIDYNMRILSIAPTLPRFVTLSSNSTQTLGAYSDDGTTWQSCLGLIANFSVTSIASSPEKYIAVGSEYDGSNLVATNKFLYSNDGINWNVGTLPYVGRWGLVAYGNGTYVISKGIADGYANTQDVKEILVSTDGLIWTKKILPFGDPSTYWGRLEFTGNLFFLVGYNNPNILTSSDGINWQYSTVVLGSTASNLGISYGNNVYVAVFVTIYGTQRKLVSVVSSDGLTWFIHDILSYDIDSGSRTNIVFANGKFTFIFGSTIGTTYELRVYYSTDGIVWNYVSLPSIQQIFYWAIGYANGIFVGTANFSKKSARSLDGLEWSVTENMPATGSWLNLAYLPRSNPSPNTAGYFVGGVTTGGVIVTTADKLVYSTDITNAQTSADLSQARYAPAGCSGDGAKGYFAGGSTDAGGSGVVALADKLTYADDTTVAQTTANISQARYLLAGISEGSTKGYFAGGYTVPNSYILIADKIIYSTDTTNAQTSANLSQARYSLAGCSGEGTKGYFAGGVTISGGIVTTADKLVYSTDTTTAQTSANLSQARRSLAGISEGLTKGYFAGGSTGSVYYSTADKLIFSTDTTAAQTSANLSQAREFLGGCSGEGTKGYFAGGRGDVSDVTTADKLVYSTDTTTSQTSANLSQARYAVAGVDGISSSPTPSPTPVSPTPVSPTPVSPTPVIENYVWGFANHKECFCDCFIGTAQSYDDYKISVMPFANGVGAIETLVFYGPATSVNIDNCFSQLNPTPP